MSDIIFIIAGMVCFIEAIYRIYKKSNYKLVQGLCIHIYTIGWHLPDKKKCCFKYKYKDLVYEYTDKYYYPYVIVKKGNTYKLFINPDNPKECITPSYLAVTRDLIILGIGLVILPFLF